MNRPKNKYCFLILIIGMLLMIRCEPTESVLHNDELIFSNSFPITIPYYEFEDSEGKIYTIQKDSTIALYPDTVNDQPAISWDSILARYISAGIFSAPIDVRGTEIKNVDDLVWQWNTGMEFENESFIQFSEGRNVINGTIDYENEPTPLNGGNYYWAVWAWDNGAIKILFSSKERSFYVEK